MILSSVNREKVSETIRLREPFSNKPIRVVLVEKEPEVRKRWIKRINSFRDLACTSACATGEETLKVISLEQPEVVLMDIILPHMSGVECTYELKKRFPGVQVVIFTVLKDQKSVFHSLEAGADGYLLKQTQPLDLRTALLEVLDGGSPMSAPIARCVVESFRRKVKNLGNPKRLSLMEELVLMQLCEGHKNRVIASKLGLSINTVCCHLKHVFKKLRVNSRTEAMIRYMTVKTSQPRAHCWPRGGSHIG